jgi:hypothetical protein
MDEWGRIQGSFRDPSGFLFTREGVFYRQINQVYQPHYDLAQSSGLFAELIADGLLIPHQEVDEPPADAARCWRVIRPQRINFISYPYEWSFSQLKDAALATLAIQVKALKHGLTLKDASAYNIQFHQGHPLLIDTLSFEIYPEGTPWVAYKQFCQHFLAPLALMAKVDIRLNQLLKVYIDGIPLDLASTLLPYKNRFNFGLLSHLFLHADAQKRYAGQDPNRVASGRQVSRMALDGLISNLEATTQALKWAPGGTEWAEYYDQTNYSTAAFQSKKQIVQEFLTTARPASAWDLGANNGTFSRLASDQDIPMVAFDIDPAAVEINYRECKDRKEANMLPLVMDLTNPSAGIGWGNTERQSLVQRGPVDAVMALALVHHLAISNNVPLPDLAAYFASLGKWLIIEFVPKDDSQVKRLLVSRVDIFPNYTRAGFEAAFGQQYTLRAVKEVEGSQRLIYLMENKNSQ